ncbi:MAG: hypothetical protein EG826_07220 [Deltaproteobacteria bacterium]|nr:hypothetical protein [Deltaproteobacteria bacterium]
MRKAHFFFRFVLVLAACLAPAALPAEEAAGENRGAENVFVQVSRQMPAARAFPKDPPAGPRGQTLWYTRAWNKDAAPESSLADLLPSLFCSGQAEWLQRAAGFTQHIFSFDPLIAGGNFYYLRNIFTFMGFRPLPTFHSTLTGGIGGNTSVADLLKMSGPDTGNDLRLAPDHPANYGRGGAEPAALTPYYDPALKPFIHNPFHDTTISIYLPISVSASVTIAPAITYAFSTNNTNNQELKGKGLVNNLIDKDSAIIYGGIHLKYSF